MLNFMTIRLAESVDATFQGGGWCCVCSRDEHVTSREIIRGRESASRQPTSST